MSVNIKSALEVYFIAGTQDVIGRSLTETLQEALDAGITCFQYREKGPGSLQNKEEVKIMAKKCLALCQAAGVPFVMNDDVEMALGIGADGIHVGQDDKEIVETIQLVQGELFVGLSVNTFEQFKKADMIEGLDYVGIGPVYATTSKADAQETIGLDLLKRVTSRQSNLPIVAIGGISEENLSMIKATAITGVAVISTISKSNNMKQTIKNLKA